jgi:Xaa-Pro dipeptidase
LCEAPRVGTDGLTPTFARLIAELVTPAELVDAAPCYAKCSADQDARRDHLPRASAISEAALSAMEDALAPGITERDLLGIYHERIASLGAPMSPSEGVCFATPSQVQSWVTEEGIGGCLERGTVLVGSAGPSALTRYGRL